MEMVTPSDDDDDGDSDGSLPSPSKILATGGPITKSTPLTDVGGSISATGSPSTLRGSATIQRSPDTSPRRDFMKHKSRSRRDEKGRSLSPKKQWRISRTFGGLRSRRDAAISPTVLQQQSYKFDLRSLVQQSESDNLSRQQRNETLRAFDDHDHNSKASSALLGDREKDQDTALLASVVHDNGDEQSVDRVLLALQRTEAFQQEKRWSFFQKSSTTTCPRRSAPQLRDPTWGPLTRDQFTREQIFLSGFAQEIAPIVRLSDDFVTWLIEALTFETREDLQTAYLDLLSSIPQQVSSLLTKGRIDELLRELGATDSALDTNEEVKPTSAISQESRRPPGHVVCVLTLLVQLAPHLTRSTREYCLHLAGRMVLDDAIFQDAMNQQAVACLVTCLLGGLPEASLQSQLCDLCASLFRSVRDVSLRAQLVQRFPAFTMRSSSLRRKLAMAFLFDDLQAIESTTTPILERITFALNDQKFRITRETDFSKLAAHVTFFNVALDDGEPPRPDAGEETHKAYNGHIDELATKVKEIFSSIIDTGASHMRRTQVKQDLESLHSRILYAMRTKRKRRTLMLGDDGTDRGSTMRQGTLKFSRDNLDTAKLAAKEKITALG